MDTGAQGNTFPLRFYREWYPQNIARRGQTTKRESTRVSFYVTEIPGPAFIGLQSSFDLKLFIYNLQEVTDEKDK